jgi:hypothetical protein
MCAERRARTAFSPGFSMVEALVALTVIGGAVAAVLPPLARALSAKAERDAGVSAVLFAQSLLEVHAPPGAARPGRWDGTAREGRWRVEIGPGEEGPRGLALRPVRVTVGAFLLETLRPGPTEP